MTPQLQRLRAAGADALFLVANATPGAQMMRSLERMNWKVPVISHWGISGGRFPELAGRLYPTVEFVQTYSFFGPQNEVGKRFIEAARKKYPDLKDAGDLIPPVGYANAYDAMHLTALAITAAGSVEGDAIRQGFYKVGKYQGLIKTYTSPFTPANHDALTENDYVMVRYKGDDIVPVTFK
jgi:branched-chain amino acid transport system substrate-binding protein